MALGQETLTHSRRPRLQNSSSGHAKPLIATRVARFLPVLDKSDLIWFLHSDSPFLGKRKLLSAYQKASSGESLLSTIYRASPSTMRPRSSTTSNQSMWRMVFEASAIPDLTASAKLMGEVPTNSTILYVPAISFPFVPLKS